MADDVKKSISLRQQIWDKRNKFIRIYSRNIYPNSLILSRDVYSDLLEECNEAEREMIFRTGEYCKMEISIILEESIFSEHPKEKIIKVAGGE